MSGRRRGSTSLFLPCRLHGSKTQPRRVSETGVAAVASGPVLSRRRCLHLCPPSHGDSTHSPGELGALRTHTDPEAGKYEHEQASSLKNPDCAWTAATIANHPARGAIQRDIVLARRRVVTAC